MSKQGREARPAAVGHRRESRFLRGRFGRYALAFLMGFGLASGAGLCLYVKYIPGAGFTASSSKREIAELAALRAANEELEGLLADAGTEHFSRYLSPAMEELHKMVIGPDEAIDLARANLLVASEIPEFRGLDIEKVLAEIDGIVDTVRKETARCRFMFEQHPEKFFNRFEAYQISILGSVLRDDVKIRYKEGKLDHRDPGVLFLNGLLERREGTCVSMPILYLVVGLRLGYPLHGVVVTDHTFCRWDDGKWRQNIEATGAGFGGPDEEYIRDMGATEAQLKSSHWMQNLTPKQMIGLFIHTRSAYWAKRGLWVRTRVDLARAATTIGDDPFVIANIRLVEGILARRSRRVEFEEPPLVYPMVPSGVRGGVPPPYDPTRPIVPGTVYPMPPGLYQQPNVATPVPGMQPVIPASPQVPPAPPR